MRRCASFFPPPAVLICALAAAACHHGEQPDVGYLPAPGGTVAVAAGSVADAVPPTADVLPAGSALRVQLAQSLSARSSRVGDHFTARVARAIIARNGETVIPAGASVRGTITGIDPSEHAGDQAAIRLDFDRIDIRGVTRDFDADILDVDLARRDGLPSTDAPRTAATGATVGAVVTGELRDVLVSGELGAGMGSIIALGAGEVAPVLPTGTTLTLRTTRSVEIRR